VSGQTPLDLREPWIYSSALLEMAPASDRLSGVCCSLNVLSVRSRLQFRLADSMAHRNRNFWESLFGS